MFDEAKILEFYKNASDHLKKIREVITHPMTLTEKIWHLHSLNKINNSVVRGSTYCEILPDCIALEDKSAQIALLQLVASFQKKVKIPTSVHCDNLVTAEYGGQKDLAQACLEKKEIYEFLQNASYQHGIDFWAPGSGMMHQILMENYIFPGSLIAGTNFYDSSAGGLGAIALSCGGNDAINMASQVPWEVEFPKIIGVCLKGHLKGWSTPKDLIMKLSQVLNLTEGKETIIEYFGQGAETISCLGKGIICSMGRALGAKASVFHYDETMSNYLRANSQQAIAESAEKNKEILVADLAVLENCSQYYDKTLTIDLSEIEPYIKGPQDQDHLWPLSEFASAARHHGYPEKISQVLINSPISSYEDFGKISSIIMQALRHGFKLKCPLLINLGSEQMEATLRRDGVLKPLETAGVCFLAKAQGPCSGQWKRHDVTFGEKNAILTTYDNSLFGHYDGNPGTHVFVTSPEVAASFAFAGNLTFNPLSDILINDQGLPIKFSALNYKELPDQGFIKACSGYFTPTLEETKIPVSIDPSSQFLKLLEPLKPLGEKDFTDLRVLLKASCRCSADHISSPSKWLNYQGHIDHISDHMFASVSNDFRKIVGKGRNLLTNDLEPFPKIARDYKREGIGWVVIGGLNYGEGISSELAAMEPRYLGAKAVIAKSFAKAHEIHLKKQGLLALSFVNPEDYTKIREDDFLDIQGMQNFKPDKPLRLFLKHANGKTETLFLHHSYNEEQIQWFEKGSALNKKAEV